MALADHTKPQRAHYTALCAHLHYNGRSKEAVLMAESGSVVVRVWQKSLPSRTHLDHDEDLGWSAANGMAHVVVDGMGSARRRVAGREIGGEHAAGLIGTVLDARLQGLPSTLAVPAAR